MSLDFSFGCFLLSFLQPTKWIRTSRRASAVGTRTIVLFRSSAVPDCLGMGAATDCEERAEHERVCVVYHVLAEVTSTVEGRARRRERSEL